MTVSLEDDNSDCCGAWKTMSVTAAELGRYWLLLRCLGDDGIGCCRAHQMIVVTALELGR